LPSQKPLLSQLAAPALVQVPVGSVPPPGTGEQVPAVAASAHERQVPVQAVRQQTPCAQNPVVHSCPSAQVAPGGLRPQEPPVHTAGAAQSASAVQVALHTEAPQWKGKHEVEEGVTHLPAPSHVAPGVNVVPPAGQLGSAQGIPCAYLWHAPASHMPLVPQESGLCDGQVLAGSGAPAGTSVQAPMAPERAHDLQALAQAVAQQTPCAQNPDAHSALLEQNAPGIFWPHELPAPQTLGATQLSSEVQPAKQRAPLQLNGAHDSDAGATHCPVLLQVAAGV
jgi:hypothetical protein